MKLAGIICEYNPFHNGHLYHIAQTRKVTGADGVICIMSGPFTQRGIPAVTDMWTRTRMALIGGADAVFQLPFNFAVTSAQFFALGGLLTAEALGLDYLSFGSESGTDTITSYAKKKCSPEFTEKLNALLDENVSYARAASAALGEERIKPNDILGTEYVRAIIDNNLNIKPFAIRREGCGHDEAAASGIYSSASDIRKMLLEGDIEGASAYVPAECMSEIVKWASECRFTALSDFDGIISYVLRRLPLSTVCALPFAQGGYGDLIKKNAEIYNTAAEIVAASTSGVYTASRAQRFIIQALVSGDGVREDSDCRPEYARLLGFTKEASSGGILREIKKRASVPVVTSVSDYMNSGSERGIMMMGRDIEASDLYASVQNGARTGRAKRDYTEKIIKI